MKYIIFAFSLLLPFFAQAQDKEHYQLLENEQNWAKNQIQFRGETTERGFDVTFAVIDIAVDPAVKYIDGNVQLEFKITKDNVSQLELDLVDQLTVDSIIYQGSKVNFTHESAKIKIPFGAVLPLGTLSAVTVYYHGDPPSGAGFGSFIQDDHGPDGEKKPILWTLSEPYGAYEWWPCKQDLTDKIDSLDMIVTVPEANKVAGNGLLVSLITNNGKATYHWQHRYPIPAYLVAFATTNYVEYQDTIPSDEGDIIQLNYVYPESLNYAKTGTHNLIEVMQVFNELFGTYPFWKEKYGHAQFGWGGGMEHTTMTFCVNFNHGLLSHELAHQWFGDDVTCGSWEDIWLNEGFATYLEGLTYEHGLGTNTFDNWLDVKANTVKEQPGGSVKVDDTTTVGRIFSWRLTYSKGAMVLHMLRWTVGDDAFFQGVRNYLQDPNLQYGFSRTENLKAHLEATSGKDLTEFFDSWYSGEGYPIYYLKWSQGDDNIVHLNIKQAQSIPSQPFFKMPVPVQLIGAGFDTTVVMNNNMDNQDFDIQLDGKVDAFNFDPKRWLVANNSIEHIPVSINNIKISDLVQLTPNPTHDLLMISVGDLEVTQLTVFDLAGKMILRSNTKFSDKLEMEVCSLRAGQYVLMVQTVEGMGSVSFVKY